MVANKYIERPVPIHPTPLYYGKVLFFYSSGVSPEIFFSFAQSYLFHVFIPILVFMCPSVILSVPVYAFYIFLHIFKFYLFLFILDR